MTNPMAIVVTSPNGRSYQNPLHCFHNSLPLADISEEIDVTLSLPDIDESDDPLLGSAIAEGRDLKPHIVPFVQIVGKHLITLIPRSSKAQYNRYAKMCVEKYESLMDRTRTASSSHVYKT